MPVTLNGVLQVLIYLFLVLLITKPVGLYMFKVFNGERTWLSPVVVPTERLFYRLCGINPEEEQKWTGYVIAMLVFSVAGMLLTYLILRTQQWVAVQPAGSWPGRGAARLQYGCQFHHQHQLAELRRGADHELLQPDGCPGVPPVRLCGDRYSAGSGADPRAGPPQRADAGQLLGGFDAEYPVHPA